MTQVKEGKFQFKENIRYVFWVNEIKRVQQDYVLRMSVCNPDGVWYGTWVNLEVDLEFMCRLACALQIPSGHKLKTLEDFQVIEGHAFQSHVTLTDTLVSFMDNGMWISPTMMKCDSCLECPVCVSILGKAHIEVIKLGWRTHADRVARASRQAFQARKSGEAAEGKDIEGLIPRYRKLPKDYDFM